MKVNILKFCAILIVILFSGCSRYKIIYNKETNEFERVPVKPKIEDNFEVRNPFKERWVISAEQREMQEEIDRMNYGINPSLPPKF